MGLFDFITSWRSILIAGGVAFVLGAGIAGTTMYKYETARCSAASQAVALAQANETIRVLEANAKLNQEALAADAAQAAANELKVSQLEEKTNDLLTQISAGVCLSSDDVDKLRSWWKAASPSSKSPDGKRSK